MKKITLILFVLVACFTSKLYATRVLCSTVVSTNADSGAGSLREAITCANSGETITFDAALAGQTITVLSTLEIPIGKNLIIDASNAPNLTLSGNNSVRILRLNSASVNPTSLTVKNLRFINGRTDEYGGAIRTTHQGILTVENCFFSNNRADQGGSAIFNHFEGTTTITNTTFDQNTSVALNDERGSTVMLWGPRAHTIRNSTFTNNRGINGAAINGLNSSITIEDCIFRGNTTEDAFYDNGNPNPFLRGFGGSIYTDRASNAANIDNGDIEIRRCIFEDNIAQSDGGALHLYADQTDKVTIEDCYFNNNEARKLPNSAGADTGGGGGALEHMNNSLNRGFTVKNCTFSNNRAAVTGGAIRADFVDTEIINCTFFNNRALLTTTTGGGAANGGAVAFYQMTAARDLRITNCTFANNHAGWVGGALLAPTYTKIKNNIFYQNTSANGGNTWNIQQHSSNEMNDLGNNIQFPAKFTNNFNDYNVSNSVTIADPLLEAIAGNGGISPTMMLQSTSPAIDAGAGCTPTDQRGVARVGVCDIGAVEFEQPPLPADIQSGVPLNCGMTEAQAIASGAATLTFNGSSYYIGYRQVTANNQNPILLKYTAGALDWCREDYETTNDDGKGYGLFWSGTDLYAVFSATGTQAGDNYTRFTTSGWLTSYGQGGGARVSIILKINTTTGEALLNNGTYIKALLNNGNANTLVVKDIYLNGDNNLVVRADSYFNPMKIDRTRMTQIGAGGSPHDYTIIFTPNLQTAVCASAVGWDNGTGIDCTTTAPTSCAISAITAANQTTCDITTNKYTQEIIVTYVDAPSTGFLVVNGQNFPIATSPQTVMLTNLDSDGNAVDVTASFSNSPSCTLTESGLFTAPASCSDDVLNVNQSTVYGFIQDAVNAANANDVIKILSNRRYDEDVVVDKSLTFTSDATTYNQIEIDQIKVENGNTLSITGKMSVLEVLHLETNGQMSIDASTEFALRSTTTGTAMVINDSETTTIQGNVIMERFLPTPSTIPSSGGIGFDGKAYHLFSSPFSDAAINQFNPYMGLVLNTAYNTAPEPAYVRPFPTFFVYDEVNAGASTSAFYTGFISNYRVPTTNAADLLEVGKGYQANITTGQTLKFNGAFNNGTQTINLTNSGGILPQQGYNLVGNPYPSPLDWEKVIADNAGNSNLANTIYLDIPTSQYNGSFAYYVAGTGVSVNGGTKDIAAGQGFFVQATAPTGTLELKNEDRPTTYQDARFFKTTQTKGLKEGVIKLGITKDEKTDETAIYFIEGATQNFDSKFDALKIYKQNSNFATLYSYNNENELFAINGLNAFDETLQIPLAINVVEVGKHTISVREIKYFHSLSELYLYDSLTQTLHNLKEEKEYEFLAERGSDIKRFVLLFKKPSVAAFSEQNQLIVYPNPAIENIAYSLKTDNRGSYQLQLIDALGRVIWEEKQEKEGAFLEGMIDINNYSKGMYLLQISNNGTTISKRIIKE